MEAAGVLVVGILLGLLAGTTLSSSASGTLWIWGGAAALLAGAWRGETLRRWAPLFLFALVAVGFLGTVR